MKLSTIILTVLCIFVLSPCPRSWAATSISIQETQSLTFPMIGIPASGSTSLSINAISGATSGTGQIIRGAANRGVYALTAKGKGGVSISIDITGVSTSHPSLQLASFKGFYNGQSIDSFPSSTLPLPAASPASTPLYLGATVTASSTLPTGTYTTPFDITVFVQ